MVPTRAYPYPLHHAITPTLFIMPLATNSTTLSDAASMVSDRLLMLLHIAIVQDKGLL